MSRLKHIGLFEGIGGFSLAARWAGWETVAWCEWNEFGQKVLRHHFQEAEGFGDIKQTDFKKYENTIDIVTGGFPCQPYSLAGKRKGKADDRHLWPEMLRSIREIKPTWVVGENVFGLVNWDGGLVFNEVQSDLEAEGYEVQPYVLPACAINAPHRRDRVWFVAYNQYNRDRRREQQQESEQKESRAFKDTNQDGWGSIKRKEESCIREQRNISTGDNEQLCADFSDALQNVPITDSNGQHRINSEHEVNASQGGFNALNDIEQITLHTDSTGIEREHIGQTREGQLNRSNSGDGVNYFQNFPTQSPICGGDDGLPRELDGITFSKWRAESIKAYGNAIVPQVAYQIFKAINQYTNE